MRSHKAEKLVPVGIHIAVNSLAPSGAESGVVAGGDIAIPISDGTALLLGGFPQEIHVEKVLEGLVRLDSEQQVDGRSRIGLELLALIRQEAIRQHDHIDRLCGARLAHILRHLGIAESIPDGYGPEVRNHRPLHRQGLRGGLDNILPCRIGKDHAEPFGNAWVNGYEIVHIGLKLAIGRLIERDHRGFRLIIRTVITPNIVCRFIGIQVRDDSLSGNVGLGHELDGLKVADDIARKLELNE